MDSVIRSKKDSSSRRIPLHAQLEAKLREMIDEQRRTQGGTLEGELALARRFGVSRGTMRVALARLVDQGLLERRPGIGTRLRDPATESGIAAWRSFSREMAKKGIVVENLRTQYVLAKASEEAAEALRVTPGTPVWRLDRLRGWSGRPVLHSRSWFHPRLGLKGSEEFKLPLYEVIEATSGRVAATAREEFTAVSATVPTGRLLKVKVGTPLLLRAHIVFDKKGDPMEFAQVHYVSSRFSLTLEIRQELGVIAK